MIKYNLKCHNNHEFESWFSNSSEFDKLNKKNLLDCIYCPSKNIKKSIMAPMISSSKNKDKKFEIVKKEKNKLLQLRRYIEENFDKKIKKTIYGTTTLKEREELAEEGIDLLSIPWVNKDN